MRVSRDPGGPAVREALRSWSVECRPALRSVGARWWNPMLRVAKTVDHLQKVGLPKGDGIRGKLVGSKVCASSI